MDIKKVYVSTTMPLDTPSRKSEYFNFLKSIIKAGYDVVSSPFGRPDAVVEFYTMDTEDLYQCKEYNIPIFGSITELIKYDGCNGMVKDDV